MTKRLLLILTNLIGLAAVLVVNALSNSLPLNGKTPAQISDEFPNLFVPTGVTFAIWGVIYLLLLIWIGAQMVSLIGKKPTSGDAVDRIGWWFAITCTLNVAWLFAWHWGILVGSVFIMIALLLALVRLNVVLGNGSTPSGSLDRWVVFPVFGLYQGWITVALIANITAMLVGVGWAGGGVAPEWWATVVIAVGAGLAIYMSGQRRILFHGIAVAWALLGIYLKRNAAADAPTVAYAALTGMVAVLTAVFWRFFR